MIKEAVIAIPFQQQALEIWPEKTASSKFTDPWLINKDSI